MRRPRLLPSSTSTRVRCVALLLLVLQALMAASPLLERRDSDGPPRVHVEHHDAHHPNQHNDASCALCRVRATTMVASVSVNPLGPVVRRAIAVDATAFSAVSADAGRDHHSRAPPSHIG